MDVYIAIGFVIIVIFAFDIGHRWWRESEWKRGLKARRDP
jgi:hypothetical protein